MSRRRASEGNGLLPSSPMNGAALARLGVAGLGWLALRLGAGLGGGKPDALAAFSEASRRRLRRVIADPAFSGTIPAGHGSCAR